MRRIAVLHDGRKLGLRQSNPEYVFTPDLNVPVMKVSVSQLPGSYQFVFFIRVTPQGGTPRAPHANECQARVQYPWGFSSVLGGGWTDFQTVNTDDWGNATINVQSSAMRFPSQYRVTARHVASGAEVARTFNIDANGNVGAFNAQTTINTGSTQPATFQQVIKGGEVARNLAYPEVRNFAYTTGLTHMHQEHGIQGHASIPEVRQWTNSGPNPALPGVLIRVRQEGRPGPGHRNVAI